MKPVRVLCISFAGVVLTLCYSIGSEICSSWNPHPPTHADVENCSLRTAGSDPRGVRGPLEVILDPLKSRVRKYLCSSFPWLQGGAQDQGRGTLTVV